MSIPYQRFPDRFRIADPDRAASAGADRPRGTTRARRADPSDPGDPSRGRAGRSPADPTGNRTGRPPTDPTDSRTGRPPTDPTGGRATRPLIDLTDLRTAASPSHLAWLARGLLAGGGVADALLHAAGRLDTAVAGRLGAALGDLLGTATGRAPDPQAEPVDALLPRLAPTARRSFLAGIATAARADPAVLADLGPAALVGVLSSPALARGPELPAERIAAALGPRWRHVVGVPSVPPDLRAACLTRACRDPESWPHLGRLLGQDPALTARMLGGLIPADPATALGVVGALPADLVAEVLPALPGVPPTLLVPLLATVADRLAPEARARLVVRARALVPPGARDLRWAELVAGTVTGWLGARLAAPPLSTRPDRNLRLLLADLPAAAARWRDLLDAVEQSAGLPGIDRYPVLAALLRDWPARERAVGLRLAFDESAARVSGADELDLLVRLCRVEHEQLDPGPPDDRQLAEWILAAACRAQGAERQQLSALVSLGYLAARLPDPRRTDARLPEARRTDGRLPEGRRADGRRADGRLPDGRLPDGRLPDGWLPGGRRTRGWRQLRLDADDRLEPALQRLAEQVAAAVRDQRALPPAAPPGLTRCGRAWWASLFPTAH